LFSQCQVLFTLIQNVRLLKGTSTKSLVLRELLNQVWTSPFFNQSKPIFFLANAIENNKHKRVVLLLSVSEEIHKMLFSLCVPVEPYKVPLETLIASLYKHFKPAKFYLVTKHSFYQSKRRHDESIWCTSRKCGKFEMLQNSVNRNTYFTYR